MNRLIQEDVRDLRRSALDRATAMTLAATEYRRWADAADRIGPAQWHNYTDCPAWDVRALAGHVLGMAEMAASFREELRQRRAATKVGGEYIDPLTDPQVREHAHLEPRELTARIRRIGPKAAVAAAAPPGSFAAGPCRCRGCRSRADRNGGPSAI